MATVNIVLDTRRKLIDDTFPLKISIYHRGTFYINLGISLTEAQWIKNKKGIFEVQNHSKAKIYNTIIQKKKLDVETKILGLDLDGSLKRMSASDLKLALSEDEIPILSDNSNIILYFEKIIKESRGVKTQRQYSTTLNWIKKFDKSRLTFSDVNVAWLKSFESYLLNQNCSTNTVWVYMKSLRSAFNKAIDEEITENYPFRRFKVKQEKTRKRSLTIEQLIKLRDFKGTLWDEKYRDIFMLIFYLIGINLKDLVHLKAIENGRVEYKRAKTGRLYSIKVEPEALEIIEKHKGEGWLISVLDTNKDYEYFLANMNINLKKLGDPVIDSSLSTYYARHTWATIAAKLDISKDIIAKALGHGDNTVTDIYIDFDQNKVDEANRKVLDYIKGMKI